MHVLVWKEKNQLSSQHNSFYIYSFLCAYIRNVHNYNQAVAKNPCINKTFSIDRGVQRWWINHSFLREIDRGGKSTVCFGKQIRFRTRNQPSPGLLGLQHNTSVDGVQHFIPPIQPSHHIIGSCLVCGLLKLSSMCEKELRKRGRAFSRSQAKQVVTE